VATVLFGKTMTLYYIYIYIHEPRVSPERCRVVARAIVKDNNTYMYSIEPTAPEQDTCRVA